MRCCDDERSGRRPRWETGGPYWVGCFLPSHLSSSSTAGSDCSITKAMETCSNSAAQDKLWLFEVLDVEEVFSQIVFAKDMLTSNFSVFPEHVHMPLQ